MPVAVGVALIELAGGAVLTAGPLALAEIGAASFVVSAATASAVGSAALIAGSIGLNYALRPKQPTLNDLPNQASGTVPIRQAVPPRLRAYGRTRVAGCYVLFEAVDGTSVDVIAFHSGKMQTFLQLYLHDDLASVQPDGTITGAVASDGRYASGIAISYRLGLDIETAHLGATSRLPNIWTEAHRGDGIASLCLICQAVKSEDFSNNYPHGKPEPSIVGDFTPIFDPRDGSQSRGNVNTWQSSTNPILQIIDFLTRADGGMGYDWDDIVTPNLTDLMNEANLCDALVQRDDGSYEKRYTSAGFYSFDNEPAAVLAMMLATCDGWLSQDGNGALKIRIGVYRSPTVTLEKDIIVGFSIDHGTQDENVVNEITWTFTSPDNGYREMPGVPWRDELDISQRGVTRSHAEALSWVQSHSQGRRLMKRKMAKANAPRRGTLVTTLAGIEALGERWVRITDDRLSDLTNAIVEIDTGEIDLESARITFNWTIVDPTTIDGWDPSEEDYEPTLATRNVPSGPPKPQNLDGTIGGDETNGYFLSMVFDDPNYPGLNYRARWRLVDAGSGSPGSWQVVEINNPTDAGATIEFSIVPVRQWADYEVQVASIGFLGSASAWSDSAIISIASNSPQLLLFPTDLTNSVWTKSGLTANYTSALDPSGGTKATQLVETTATANHLVRQVVTVTAGVDYEFKIDVKGKSRSIILLRVGDGGANLFQSRYNLSTTAAFSSAVSGTGVFVSAQATALGIGWTEISIVGRIPAITSLYCEVYIMDGTNIVYTGDIAKGMFLYNGSLKQV
ncbi:hypothetical protein ASD45_08580 [Pseudolabrys sp. Root1462]|uniref:phage head spike fiber domain-containing protein n=1 Tax=Pseudolabrys sp. Root1462 TaxID=1736466 RepID=UPI000703B564|nr:hypothetical protein [Pseudolabrys sp. Root1462]KQZ00909.1 hypothetical protein ASD45_08580 [Pseudolabrys sp. Root1462]